MPRKLKGIRRMRRGWQAYVRVAGRFYSQSFPLETPVQEMRDWRADQKTAHAGTKDAAGGFAANIRSYLARVAAMPSYPHRAGHLARWAQALGRDRSRHAITTAEIDVVLQGWLQTLAPGTVRNRRTALYAFFAKLDPTRLNPVQRSANPKPPKAEARGRDYSVVEAAIAAMAEYRAGRLQHPSLAKIRARVIAYTGIPPGLLKTVGTHDLSLTRGTVRIVPRSKGDGVEARTLPLTAKGLAAFTDFHAANAYGLFNTGALNASFKRGCTKAGLDPKSIHLYDLRHSFLSQVYRVTRDLATVGRLGLHAEGSPLTARYARGANAEVDVAAVAAFDAALAAGLAGPKRGRKVRRKGARARKAS